MSKLGAARKNILVTGVAGFIGYHLSERLLQAGHGVIGIDNMNSYYDVSLKNARLAVLNQDRDFVFIHGDITNRETLSEAFQNYRPTIVVNLAAQAGVRYSLENPEAYIQSNLVGFANLLEECRHGAVEHLLYASSSSVYGGNTNVPFEEGHRVDHPISLYAATKRSNELMADCYAHLFGIPMTGLRFFTVYGPFGRPDMAYFKFADSFFSGKPIRLYKNAGSDQDLMRDFTYVDDVIECIYRLISHKPQGTPPHEILNVGGSQPESLEYFIETLESALSSVNGSDVRFERILDGRKPGDVSVTYASTDRLEDRIGFIPRTPLATGLRRFAEWYVGYANAPFGLD